MKGVLLVLCVVGAGCAGSEHVDAMTAFERAADPDRRAIDRLRYARLAIESGELSKAQLADAYYNQGESYYYLRSYDDALRSYRRCVELVGDDTRLLAESKAKIRAITAENDPSPD